MTALNQLAEKFPSEIALRPSANYAHIVTLRVSESYPIFRTDEGLNTAQVAAGRNNHQLVDRIAMFMRKQTTPERLRGRELLRQYQPERMESCRYNEQACGQCPDCIAYGFAVGDSGAEKAKVFGDTAYSIRGHDVAHVVRTFNAPNETGTMYDQEKEQTSNRINSTEYIVPGVIFPSVVTTRDLTFAGFAYVLNNILSTVRYGATTTRTGRMDNQVVAIVVADGEIMSNLALTQAIYDHLAQRPNEDILDPREVREAAEAVLPNLISGSNVKIAQQLVGSQLDDFLAEFLNVVSQQPQDLITTLFEQVDHYEARRSGGKKGK